MCETYLFPYYDDLRFPERGSRSMVLTPQNPTHFAILPATRRGTFLRTFMITQAAM